MPSPGRMRLPKGLANDVEVDASMSAVMSMSNLVRMVILLGGESRFAK
jgi:hypothetical protein